MAALLALLASACSSDSTGSNTGGTGPVSVASVTVSTPATEVAVGQSVQLTAVARDAGGAALTGRQFTWSTSAASRATVSAQGVVTGVSAGAVTITGTSGGQSGSAQLTVMDASVASVTVVPDTASGEAGTGLQLTAVLRDASGDTLTGRAVAWASADTTVVRVAADGTATFIAPGTTEITASTEGQSGSATLTTLPDVPVARVVVMPDTVLLEVDATQQLTASPYDDSDALLSGRIITWSSTQTSVASVNADGLVTAEAAGSAWVIAEAEGVRDSAYVSVMLAMPTSGGAIAAGDLLTCALTAEGEAYCWGRYDLVGDPDAPMRYLEPRKVAGGHRFTAIDVGSDNALALTANGTAYTWGRVPNGLQPIHGQGYEVEQIFEPTPVSGGLRFAAISAGSSHSCGISLDGDAYCWGGLHGASLGDGTESWRNAPTLVAGGHTFSRISVGSGHTLALTPTGEAWAWGAGGGLLGDSTLNKSSVPVKVAGGHTFVDVFAGHASMAVKADGSVWEWGFDRSMVSSNELAYSYPVRMQDHEFDRISIGRSHALALTPGGELWAWGHNEGVSGFRGPGALGDGTSTSSWEPVRVSGGRRYRDISAGEYYSVAIGEDGLAYGWGDNTIWRALGGNSAGTLLEPVGAVPAYMLLTFNPTRPEIPAGTSADVIVSIERVNGGFTVLGPRAPGDVTLAPRTTMTGVTATLSPQLVPAGTSTSTLTVTAASDAPVASGLVYVAASAANTSSIETPTAVAVVEPPPPPEPGQEYACPTGSTTLPAGYHCMTADGVHTAGKYSDVQLHGTWVDASAEVCLTWDPTGKQAFGRYHAGGTVTETARGEWGVMINLDGSRYPNEQHWNIYTEMAEPQTKLLTYDSATKTIVGWNFVKGSCPF